MFSQKLFILRNVTTGGLGWRGASLLGEWLADLAAVMDLPEPHNKARRATNCASAPNGPLHHSAAIGSKCGVGFPRVQPPHLAINTAAKQAAL